MELASKVCIEAIKKSVKGELHSDAPLADYTSWRTGGKADYLYLPADAADLSQFLQQLPKNMPITWLGLGSNTLIRDKGIPGVVIVTQGMLNNLQLEENNQIRAEVGVASAQLARFAARANLSGIEFMAGIPGTVGGALAMNAGCFGGETWPHVVKVETIDRQGKIKVRTPLDFTVGYRHVVRPEDEWFIAGHFQLASGDKEKSLALIRSLLERRNATQPTGTANSGSVFRNPPGEFAGRLIETCGLKGKQQGGAQVSHKHANFILNEGNASSHDIETLILDIINIVKDKTGVLLVPEVLIIGRE